VSDDPADIVRFWQAVEIFSPQNLPQPDAKNNVRDYQRGESRLMPWEPGSRLDAPTQGNVWRHQIFGGVYKLRKVRDVLVASFGDDNPEAPVKGESALFACTVDASGVPLEDSQVVSACAWACGQLVRGQSPLSDSQRETRKHTDELKKLTEPGITPGLRLLAAAIRDVIPDAVSGGIGVIVASALAIFGGPLAAAGGAAAGGIAARAAKSAMGEGGSQPPNTAPPTLAAASADALTGDDLHGFTSALARQLGVIDVLKPSGIRVSSYQIPADRAEEEPETSFLNSFIAEDLANVATELRRHNAGLALTRYLTPARLISRERTDVQRHPLVVRDGVAPQQTPAGRWVTNTNRPLAFSQQFAVNEAMAELGESAGLFAVNGPPGTGKTTMLRDLIAAIVVNRAIALAELKGPSDALSGPSHPWETETYTHKIWTPDPGLTGSEIVVGSSNNGAVENVTTEIPGAKGIGEDFRTAAAAVDYFTETALTVHGEEAWAMVAARLGNRKNRDQFADRFWFKSMRYILKDPEPPDWQAAVDTFKAALARVRELTAQRVVAAHSVSLLSSVGADREAARERVSDTSTRLGVGLARRKLHGLDREQQRLRLNVEGAVSLWGSHVPTGAEFAETQNRELIELREKSAPWADEAFARARTELFLAALVLHKALVLGAAPKFRANLNALIDILKGKGHPSDPEAVLAAWQTFFLVVPVVSSTFASFDKLFTGLGRECLGWLLIDEAGQAAPQNAVGALWRSRRAVIVGDPLQLEPVVTLPWAGQQALLSEFAVTAEWAPSRTSVQQVADQHARHGTSLPSAASGDPIWVGTPLRVHRRCDRPMFDISNMVAYDGLMVYGTLERDPFPGADGWIDIRSSDGEGHWIPAEGAALRTLLCILRDDDIPVEAMRVLSPFRMVAAEARKIHKDVFPHVKPDDRDGWVGTVHTMQGKEADVVIFVLGGDPRKPRARSFATDKPNLLNVAASRARRRLYVIGNRRAWGDDGCFTILAGRLPVTPLPERSAQTITPPELLTPFQPPGSRESFTTSGSPASPAMVWRTKSGRVFHTTDTCEALQAGLSKARQNGWRPSTPRQVLLQEALADELSGCRWCCPP
jgi:hypothetical protein